MRVSSCAARGPVVSQPERSVSATASTSSSPSAGGWKPRVVLRRVRIDVKAYGLHRTASPRARFLAVGADGHDRSGSVGAGA